MIRGMMIGVFTLACLLGLPLPAQQGQGKGVPRPPAQQRNNQKGQKQGQKPRQMGDWLREHKDMPLDQQEKLLENDPNFKNLPPQRQAELKDRLRKFNSLPPEQRERTLNRMEFMASLTHEQREEIRKANQQLQTLPQDRRTMVHKALRHLRQMSPEERQQELQSDKFRSTFSEQEQGIVKQLAAIQPPENSEPQTKQ